MNELEPIPSPMDPPMWLIAVVDPLFIDEVRARLGPPQLVDPAGDGWGSEHYWNRRVTTTGQRITVAVYLPIGPDPTVVPGRAMIIVDPPNVDPALAAVGFFKGDSRVKLIDPPHPWPPEPGSL